MVQELLSVTKALNNNVIIARDARGSECVLIGRGLGFRPLPSRLSLHDPRIEKRFVAWSGSADLAEIQVRCPDEFRCAGEALELLAKRTGLHLPDSIQGYLALHLAVARQSRLNEELPLPRE